MSEQAEVTAEAAAEDARTRRLGLVTAMLVGIFLLLLVYGLYFAREFVTPVVLGFLLALTLSPIVRFLRKRGIPSGVSATLLVLLSGAAITGVGYSLSGPVIQMIDDAPAIGRKLTERVQELRRPIDKVVEATDKIDDVATGAQESGVQRVVVAQPGILSRAAGNALSIGSTLAITMILSLFLLASGTLFYEKIVQSFTLMSDKKRALRVVYDIEREISRYLLTIALINSALGVAVGSGLWLLGLPNPLVWGVAAAVLNFLPYVGAALTIALVAVISIVTFDSFLYAMLPPLFVLFCNIVEGQFLSPVVVGRRLELNAVAIFIAVAFWSWLWGFIGALIAVPLLVVIKVFCDHFESLSHVGNFLSAESTSEPEEEAA